MLIVILILVGLFFLGQMLWAILKAPVELASSIKGNFDQENMLVKQREAVALLRAGIAAHNDDMCAQAMRTLADTNGLYVPVAHHLEVADPNTAWSVLRAAVYGNDPARRLRAVKAIGFYTPDKYIVGNDRFREVAIGLCQRLLADHEQDSALRVAAADALGSFGRSPIVVNALDACQADADVEVRGRAMLAYAQTALNDPKEPARPAATESPEETRVCDALRDPSDYVRVMAIIGLKERGTHLCLGPLKALADDTTQDPTVRDEARNAIGKVRERLGLPVPIKPIPIQAGGAD